MSSPDTHARWRAFADWAKHRQWALKLADRMGRGTGRLRWIDRLASVPRTRLTPDLSRWEQHDLAAVWVGHATVLLRVGGMTILTDPVWSNRVGIGLGVATAGPLRSVAPAIDWYALPRIDLLLVSHGHFDHLDRPTLARLSRRVPVLTARGVGDLLSDLQFDRVRELRWGDSIRVGPLKITGREVKHWGARTFYDSHRGYNAFFIESPTRRVFFGGDTAYYNGFSDLSPVDLAIFGIGAYDPYVAAHATPEQAWEMARQMRAEHVLPVHHSTFRLSYEPIDEPLRRLLTAAGDQAFRVVGREAGELWIS